MTRLNLMSICSLLAAAAYGLLFMGLIVAGGFVVLSQIATGTVEDVTAGILAGFGICKLLPYVDRIGDRAAHLSASVHMRRREYARSVIDRA